MNGILFLDFNLVACDFLKFDWWRMLNVYVDFLFNIFSLRMTVHLKSLNVEYGLNKTWINSNACVVYN